MCLIVGCTLGVCQGFVWFCNIVLQHCSFLLPASYLFLLTQFIDIFNTKSFVLTSIPYSFGYARLWQEGHLAWKFGGWWGGGTGNPNRLASSLGFQCRCLPESSFAPIKPRSMASSNKKVGYHPMGAPHGYGKRWENPARTQHSIVKAHWHSVVNMMAISWLNWGKAGHSESLPGTLIHLQEEYMS